MKKLMLILLILTISLFSGCIGEDYNKIGAINNNPEKFSGELIKIKGEVVEKYSIPLINMGAYKLEDGTGSIWIVTSSGVPGVGTKIKVEGYIATSFKLGTVNLGTVIREDHRSEMKFIETLF